MAGAKGSETELSELELALTTIVEYYNKYTSPGKKILFWNKNEGIQEPTFKKMLQTDLEHMLTTTTDKKAVEDLFQELDRNGDRVINFKEYWDLIEAIVVPIARNMQFQV